MMEQFITKSYIKSLWTRIKNIPLEVTYNLLGSRQTIKSAIDSLNLGFGSNNQVLTTKVINDTPHLQWEDPQGGGPSYTPGYGLELEGSTLNSEVEHVPGGDGEWHDMEWKDPQGNVVEIYGEDVWYDGENYIHSSATSGSHILNPETFVATPINYQVVPMNFFGSNIFTIGNDIYYSYDYTEFYKYENNDWTAISRVGNESIGGAFVWKTDNHVYGSHSGFDYIIDEVTLECTEIQWNNGSLHLEGRCIWKDYQGNLHYDDQNNHYVLSDESNRIWDSFSWVDENDDPISIEGDKVWRSVDGTIYYSDNTTQYVLDESTNKWVPKIWDLDHNVFFGNYIWNDGNTDFYSYRTSDIRTPVSSDKYITRHGDELAKTDDLPSEYVYDDADFPL